MNPKAADAWLARLKIVSSDEDIALVGFCPRYFAQTFRSLLERSEMETIKVVVERVNLDAPTQLRLLCRLTAPWPEDFHPCAEEQYKPLVRLESPGPLSLDRLEHRM